MKTIILGTAHLKSTPGKRSPDGRLKEYAYSREIVQSLKEVFKDMGYNVFVDVEEEDMKVTSSKELQIRCQRVNNLVKKYKDCIYVSIHVNASGADGKWHNGTGFEVFTSVGNTKADKLATYIYEAAKNNLQNVKLRTDYSDGDPDKEAHLYVLKHTTCPAVLTENMFQDNKNDVDFLLSDEGFHSILRLHIEGILRYIQDN